MLFNLIIFIVFGILFIYINEAYYIIKRHTNIDYSLLNVNNYFDSINNKDCKNNRTLKIYTCYNLNDTINNGAHKKVELRIVKRISFGKKVININHKNRISLSKSKIINESFNIYFIKNVIINQYGSIITQCNEYLSLKGGCRCAKEIININNVKHNLIYVYNGFVFQVTQFLGSAVYHSIINCLTKLVAVYKDIIYYRYSKIHVHNNSAIINYLNLLNIKKTRLIFGNFYIEKLIIMNRVECTSPIYTYSILELRNLLLNRIKKYKEKESNSKLLIIKRIYTRRIKNFNEVVNCLCNAIYNFSCYIYHPNDNFNKMIYYFYNADVIFGPHGAGFTNIIISKHNVKIFEIIRLSKPVLCYATLANILGFTYFGLYSQYNDLNEHFVLNVSYIENLFHNFISLL